MLNNLPTKMTVKKVKKVKFSGRQKLFIKKYIATQNATQSAIFAGYSRKTASQAGSRLVALPKIRCEIDAVLLDLQDRTGLHAQTVLEELAKVVFSDISDYISVDKGGARIVDFKKIKNGATKCVRKIKSRVDSKGNADVQLELYDKVKGIELLMKHLGMLENKENAMDRFSITVKTDNGDELLV